MRTASSAAGAAGELAPWSLNESLIRSTPEVSAQSLAANLEAVCGIGPRWHGTPAEEQTIELMSERLRAVCDQVELEEFPYTHYTPQATSLQISRPLAQPLHCVAVQYSGTGRVAGQLVYAGQGHQEDFQALRETGASLRDRIVLMRTNQPYLAGGYARADGACGIVVISDSPFGTVRQMTSQMGYEPGEDLSAFGLPIPGVIVSREDGERLLSLLSAGPVEGRIEHRSAVQVRRSHNVIGYQWGKDRQERSILIGAHYDTQFGLDGAWDNGSGCAALLEIARVCAGSAARRTRIFCAFGGEEIGLFGSTAFVRRRAEELKRVLAYFNLDSTSGDVPYTHDLLITRRLEGFARELVASYSDWLITSCREFTVLDHEQDSAEFVRQGVEAFWAHEEGNAFFHTVYDSLDTVDPAKLARATRVALLPFHYLAHAEIVPI